MITDVPSAADFRAYGVRYLNFGWGQALRIALEIVDLQQSELTHAEDNIATFAKKAEPEVATAITFVAQGAEFLLKSRIAGVSPWLLLSKNPDGWPRQSDQKDVPFAEFRTIDAQDLPKVHDTFCADRLSEDFKQAFRALRLKRNAMTHTIDIRLQTKLSEIIEMVLVIAEALLGSRIWPAERSAFLENDRHAAVDSTAAALILAREFEVVTATLSEEKLEKYFGLPRDQVKYLCGRCRHNFQNGADLHSRTAVLMPNSPEATKLYCFVCRGSRVAIRQRCTIAGCSGDAICKYEGECFSCGGYPDLGD